MEKDYKSLEDYIISTKGGKIEARLLRFVKENSDSLEMGCLSEADADSFELESFDVKRVKCEKTDNPDEIVLYVHIYAMISGDVYRRHDYSQESCYKYFCFKCKGSFSDSFDKVKIISISEEKESASRKDVLTDHLIPYISNEQMEEYATEFLLKYCPQALKKPMKSIGPMILDKMGLEYHFAPLEEGVFGKTFFKDGSGTYLNEDLSYYEGIIKEGTVLINPDCYFFGGVGNLYTTMIHEAVHWHLHKNFFNLLKIIRPNLTHISCENDEKNRGFAEFSDDLKWMERQANSLAPKILAPKDLATKRFSDILIANDFYNDKSSFTKGEIFETSLRQFAQEFNLTRLGAKIRLIELGFTQAIGIGNYIDDELIKPFYFKDGKLKKGESYVIDNFSFALQSTVNKDLREKIQQGLFVYVNHFVVLNDAKYVRYDGQNNPELTRYALDNVDECCIPFTCVQKKHETKDIFYSLCFLCKKLESSNLLESKYDPERTADYDQETINKLKVQLNKEKDFISSLPNNGGETIKSHIKRRKITQEILSERSGLDNRTISAYCNQAQDYNPTITGVVAICIGLNLSPTYSRDLLKKFGFDIDSRHDDLYNALRLIIDSCHMYPIDECNKILRDLGCKKMLPK